MKKTKVVAILLLILTLVLNPMSGAGMVVKAADEGVPDVKIEFIDVCTEKGKADATLIQANHELVLVDCGATTPDLYNKLKERIKVRYLDAVGKKELGTDKIKLKAIVITHNHVDHMAAFSDLLKDESFEIEQVYYSEVQETAKYKGSRLESIENAIADKKTLEEKEEKKEKLVVHKIKSLPEPSKRKKKDLDPYIIRMGGTDVKVYRPVSEEDCITIPDPKEGKLSKKKATEKKEILMTNNRSMIVRVVTNNKYVDAVNKKNKKTKLTTKSGMTALLLGDLYINGLVAAKNVYGDTIFSLKREYKICKVGHHGVRPSSFWHDPVKLSGLKNKNSKFRKVDAKSKKIKYSELDFWSKSGSKKETYVDSDIRFYNQFIGARYYVFNTTNGSVEKESKKCVAAYNKFIGGSLKYPSGKKSAKSKCVKLGNLFHMYPSVELKRGSISPEKDTACVKLKKK